MSSSKGTGARVLGFDPGPITRPDFFIMECWWAEERARDLDYPKTILHWEHSISSSSVKSFPILFRHFGQRALEILEAVVESNTVLMTTCCPGWKHTSHGELRSISILVAESWIANSIRSTLAAPDPIVLKLFWRTAVSD
jgi:hypothetical protein